MGWKWLKSRMKFTWALAALLSEGVSQSPGHLSHLADGVRYVDLRAVAAPRVTGHTWAGTGAKLLQRNKLSKIGRT